MASVVRENIGLLNDKLTVKLTKEDYLPAFNKKLKEYSKTANIPGFRKGMVPTGMMKKMYGPGIFSEEVLRTIEKELYAYLEKERPQIFAQPLPLEDGMSKLDMNNAEEVEFAFEIGLKPAYSLPEFSKGTFTKNNVNVTDEMVNEEIDRMRLKAGKMQEKEAVDSVEDVVNVLFTECDENSIETEGGVVKENSVIVKYFNPKMQQQMMGKKAGESFVFQLASTFEADKLEMMLQDLGFAKDDAEAAQKYFKLEIKTIGIITKRELDEAFFEEVYPSKGIKTEAELQAGLREELEKYWASQTRNQLHDQLYHYLLDETKMEFPKPFLTRWLKTGGDKTRTQEEAEAEYPIFEGQLKWTLISDQIIRENKLEVTDDEIRESMREEVSRYFGQMSMSGDLSWLDSYLDRMMKDEKQLDATYRRLISEKLFSYVETQVNPTEKKVTVDELLATQHKH